MGRPIRLLWTRADDMRHGRLRPASHHRARATHLLGQVLSYEHCVASVALDGSHGLGELLTSVGVEVLGGVGPAMFHLSQLDLYHLGVQARALRVVDLAFPTGSLRSVFSGQVRAGRRLPAVGAARHPRGHRPQVRMRRGRVLRVHQPPRRRRLPAVHHPGRRLRRPHRHHRRGPADGDTLHPVQQAWIDEDVAQRGYCQPGQIMAALALLAEHPHPSDADIGTLENVCRCGTYVRIHRAIHRAAGG